MAQVQSVEALSKKRRRRIRSPHPGVVLLKPDIVGRHAHWRARFADPDSGKLTKVKLDPLALPTAETRRDWAIRKAKELARRRMELETGAPRATGTAIGKVIEHYFEGHPQLRERTLEDYRAAADKLIGWAARTGITLADDLTRPALISFRETLVAEPKRAPLRGRGQRGQREPTAKRRAATTINSELRRLRTVLGYLSDLDLFVRLSHDDLRRAFKHLPVAHERVEYLKPTELRKLLEAATRHDQDTFAATRDEHAGRGNPGSTSRYDPIAPFVAFVMFTGMRFGEAIGLDWHQVDLDALDWDGRVTGEIHLAGSSTKTHKARSVGLDVSPALRKLLAAMHKADGGRGAVFKFTDEVADSAAKRLKREYGAPKRFGWQMLRRTCGTFLTNAPGIFGSSSAYRSAKQLGHSVAIAERHYVDVARGIPLEARTLEAAMQVEEQLGTIIARLVDKAES